MSSVIAYWAYTIQELLCVGCWQAVCQREGEETVPGQAQGAEDIGPGETCAHCHKRLS